MSLGLRILFFYIYGSMENILPYMIYKNNLQCYISFLHCLYYKIVLLGLREYCVSLLNFFCYCCILSDHH
jgi:hypothetical protein